MNNQPPTQSTYPVVLLAVIIIALLGAVYFFFYRPTKVPQAPEKEALLNFPPSTGGNPFLSSTPSQTSTRDCFKEEGNAAQDACWQSRAVTEKKSTFCNNIKESTPFVSRDTCLNLVAHEKKDKTLCAKIQDANLKKNCEKTIK